MSPDITKPANTWPRLQGEGHYVAVDTETTGLYVDDGKHVTVISLAGDGWSVAIPFDVVDYDNAGKDIWDGVLDWLSRQKIIMHHAKFDLDMLRRGAPHGWLGRDLTDQVIFDTKLAAWIAYPLESSSLKPTAERLWGEIEREEQRACEEWLIAHDHKPWQLWFVPGDILLPYARQDAELTFRLYQHINTSPHDFGALIDRELEVMKVLSRMESRGIGFDVKMADWIDNGFGPTVAVIKDELPFKPTRPAYLKWLLQSGHKLDYLPKTEGGQPSMGADGMKILVEKGVPCAKEFQHLLDLELAHSRYFGDRDELDAKGNREASWKMMVGKDGRLRGDFQQDGTVSTRFSCRRVNLQAMPQDFKTDGRYPTPRVCMTPKPGHLLVSLDLSQAEIRVAAAVTGSKRLRHIIVSGEDIHGSTARLIFPGVTESSTDWKAKRFIAKTLNLAIQYGAGIGEIASQLGCTETQAAEYRNRYHQMFPEVKPTMQLAQHKADTQGYVTLVSGRRSYFGPDDKTFAAFNRVIQGDVSEAIKDAMVYTERTYPGWLLLQVHDELVLEVPESEMEKVGDLKKAIESMMTETFGIKMEVDVKVWQHQQLTSV